MRDSDRCPICGRSDLSPEWVGYVIVFDPNSEIARKLGVDKPGRYALKVR